MEGETGNGLVTGTSFGSANTFSPGLGTSQTTGAANESTATQVGGTTANVIKATGAEITFGNGFGEYSVSGGGAASFGSPLGIPGSGTPFIPGTPAVGASAASFVQPLETGGSGGGFGGGIGNVIGDAGKSNAYGYAQSAGFPTLTPDHGGENFSIDWLTGVFDFKPTGTASESTTTPGENSDAGATSGGKKKKKKKKTTTGVSTTTPAETSNAGAKTDKKTKKKKEKRKKVSSRLQQDRQ
jgi:hypothetical protein